MMIVISQTIEVPDDTPTEYLDMLQLSAFRHVSKALTDDVPDSRMISSGYIKHAMVPMNLETGERL